MRTDLEASVRDAIESCLAYARRTRKADVGEIAGVMGLKNKWVLYKWVESGRLPANQIPSFEAACGCADLSEALGLAAGVLTFPTHADGQTRLSTTADAHLVVARGLSAAIAAERHGKYESESALALDQAIDALRWLRDRVSTQGSAHG